MKVNRNSQYAIVCQVLLDGKDVTEDCYEADEEAGIILRDHRGEFGQRVLAVDGKPGDLTLDGFVVERAVGKVEIKVDATYIDLSEADLLKTIADSFVPLDPETVQTVQADD